MDTRTVYVLGSDLNLWYEIGPFGNVDITVSNRSQIDANVNDFQPLRVSTGGGSSPSGSSADVIFILGRDANLWLTQGPFQGIANTVNNRKLIDSNVIAFGAGDPSNLFIIGGD